MKSQIDPADMLRLCNRHKAKTLTKMEQLSCPEGFLEIARNGFGYLRNDLMTLADQERDGRHRTK